MHSNQPQPPNEATSYLLAFEAQVLELATHWAALLDGDLDLMRALIERGYTEEEHHEIADWLGCIIEEDLPVDPDGTLVAVKLSRALTVWWRVASEVLAARPGAAPGTPPKRDRLSN